VTNDERDDEFMIYGPGAYKVGTDIPAGLYMAKNDGSNISRVVVKDSPEPDIEKPNIIVTARYLSDRGTFAERAAYVESVSRGGGVPVQPKDDEELAEILREGLTEYADELAKRYDGLVLTGGGDVAAHFFNQEHHPASNPPDETLDIAEIALTRAFIKANKPVLGICRGMQVINIAMGGDLIQDIPDLLGLDPEFHNDYEARHPIKIRSGTWLYDLVGSQADVNTTHHQCIDDIAPGFTVVAQIGPVVEAMESGNVLGVQFHPERMLDEGMLPLFKDFIERCSYRDREVNIFTEHIIIELEENHYIDIRGATLTEIENTLRDFNKIFDTEGHYPEGMYWIGHHVPEGVYRLNIAKDADFSHYAVYRDISRESLTHSGVILEDGRLITLTSGQFVSLIYATMTPVSAN